MTATATHGSVANLLANGYDLSEFFNSIDAGGGTGQLEDTGFGPIGSPPVAKSYIPDMGDATLKCTGKYVIDTTGLSPDKVADVIEAALGAESAGSKANIPVTYLPLGDGFGLSTFEILSTITTWNVTSPVNAIVSCEADFQSSVGSRRGKVLQPAQPATGTVNGATLDAGALYDATKWKGISANAHVLSAGAGVTCKVQHSTDGVTWVDLVTFTVRSADHQAENQQVLGTVNRYLRAQVVAASTATVHIAAGRIPA